MSRRFSFAPLPLATLAVCLFGLGVFVRGTLDDLRAPPAPVVLHYAPAEDLEAIDVATLDKARHAIDMAAYVLTDAPVIAALARAARRGVRVRILFDRGQIDRRPETDPLIALQDIPGVSVRVKRGFVLMHLKAYQVDGLVLRVGSANFSHDGLRRQDNELQLLADPAAATAFAAAFDRLFTAAAKE